MHGGGRVVLMRLGEVVRMRCLMQVDEVLAFCFNAFSCFLNVILVVGPRVVFLLADCGSVSGLVCLFACVFAASCVINK